VLLTKITALRAGVKPCCAKALGRLGSFIKTSEVDAGRIDYGHLDPDRFEVLRRSILEALGRAYYNSGQHAMAAETFEALLAGWKAQGYTLVAMRDLVAKSDPAKLPLHSVLDGPVAGRSGLLASQGPEFLGAAVTTPGMVRPHPSMP